MYYQKMYQLEKGNLCLAEDNHSHSFRREDPKVNFIYIIAPGPGSYRLPSDFGHYDENALKAHFSKGDFGTTGKTGRTSSTSNGRRE